MDGSRFDTLSRALSTTGSRRRALGGFFLGSFGLLSRTEAEDAIAHDLSKKCKKKSGDAKKKCLKKAKQHAGQHTSETPPPPTLVDPCPGQKLCQGACIPVNQCCTDADCPSTGGYLCCNGACSDTKRTEQRFCDSHQQCCSNYCRQDWDPSTLTCEATCLGKSCLSTAECCRGLECLDADPSQHDAGFGHCGPCRGPYQECQTDADCCYSACKVRVGEQPPRKVCGSYTGGRCARSIDCEACQRDRTTCNYWINNKNRNICKDGVCGCPTQCCSNADCPVGYLCQNGTCRVILG